MEEFKPQTPEVKPENLGEILDGKEVKDLIDAMKVYQFESGEEVMAGTDMGVGYRRNHNEDRIGVLPSRNFVAVVDGMGGPSQGDVAAQILVEELLALPDDTHEAGRRARAKMSEKGIFLGGAVFSSFRLRTEAEGKFIDWSQMGDTKMLIIKSDGTKSFESKDESLLQMLEGIKQIEHDATLYDERRHIVDNAVTPSERYAGPEPHPPIKVEKGDFVLLMSDGMSDNFTGEEIASKVKEGLTPRELFIWLGQETTRRMQNKEQIIKDTGGTEGRKAKGVYSDGYLSEPKCDNRALAITQIT